MEKFLLFLITPSFAYCDSLGHDIATYLEGAVGERIGGAIGGVAGGILGELIGQEGIIPGAIVGQVIGTGAGGVAAIGTAHILSKYKKYT